ncbi:MAG: macrolide ABC transporter permease [Balneola sp.]|jgi:putative ABC transport system permease protein|nr:macrolide ABC transporter permease [Balneola sp.]MBE78257.1 macrolide ABC transporter permease [Balneola sp.]|tara:strand:+ start:353 stop:2818 length:2466 start_codon:yes stop_codon:yes gene_type:complete
MLKNYFKIAFRNLFKNKVYSSINIFGLAAGIACCILIALYVHNEWSYDSFHSKADRTYRVWYEETTPDQRVLANTATPVILSPTIQDNIPEVEHITYLFNFNNLVKTVQKPEAQSEGVLVVNDDFFQMFDFELLQGDKSTIFNNPSSVVLSESVAKRLFGNQNPVQQGLSIRIGDEYQEFSISGVIEDTPTNSSLPYNILMPYENLKNLISEQGRQSWFNIYGSTYLTLSEGVDPSTLDEKFAAMMESTLGPDVYEETQYTINLQPLTDIHLNTELAGGLASVSDPVYSYILSVIAFLILLIACVNFMTLSISRSTSRAKEVGIRKTIGAIRQHLMYQFWGEALLMTVIAFVFGLTFAEFLLPLFNELSGTELNLSYSLGMIGSLTVTAIIVSLFAGIYPALVLSGFRPIEVLKGRIRMSSGKGRFQQFMVVLQFALSISLIIGTITIQQQLNYVQNKNLGFQKDQVLVFDTGITNTPQNDPDDVFENAARIKQLLENQLGASPEISSITVSSFTPVQTGGWFQLGFTDNEQQVRNFHGNVVDADFIPSLGIQVLEGRNFSEENTSDQRRAIIVNQAMVDYFGWENPLGESLPGPEFVDHEVIGVVENFHYESLHTSVDPLAMSMSFETLFSGIQNLGISNSFDPRISVNLTTSDIQQTVGNIREVFATVAPGTPFNYTFVDQALDAQYRQEQRLSRIVATGSIIAIIIACLGLFGLASLMVIRKTKEIGVRKVLGASSGNIVLLVNKEFTKLVAIAFVIAAPVAWYGMKTWLQDFAYRIELGIGIFLLAGMVTLAVAWLTVSYQSIKATLINPTESLRSE